MGRRACEWIVRHQDDFFASRGGLKRVKYAAELALIVGTLTDELTEGPALLARSWDAIGQGDDIARLSPVEPVAATSYLPFRLAGVACFTLAR